MLLYYTKKKIKTKYFSIIHSQISFVINLYREGTIKANPKEVKFAKEALSTF